MEHYLKTRIGIMAILCSMSLVQSCYAQEDKDPIPKEDMDRVKKVYEFEKWAGKVKLADKEIRRLEFGREFFDKLSSQTKIYTPEKQRQEQLDMLLRDKKTDLNVSVDIYCMANPFRAHKGMLNGMALCTFPLPAFRQLEPNDPNLLAVLTVRGPNEPNSASIGDICFVPRVPWKPASAKTAIVYSLIFCRNNVLVDMRIEAPHDRKEYPNLLEMALAIDEKLKAISEPKK